MPRSRWGLFARGGAAVSLVTLVQCTLLLDLSGLDRGTGGGDGSDGSISEGGGLDGRRTEGGDGTGPISDSRSEGDTFVASDADGWAPKDATDESPRDAGPVDADSDAACMTSFSGAGAGVLFSFNTIDVSGWAATANTGGPTTSLGWTASDGNKCPGALTVTANFKAYDGITAGMQFTYGSGASWNGTKLHVWVRLRTNGDGGAADYAALNTVQLFVLSNAWANFSFVSENINPTFGDGDWHEIVMQLAADGGQAGRSGPDVVTSSIQQFGIAIAPDSARPANGPAVPPTTIALLDDVWLE